MHACALLLALVILLSPAAADARTTVVGPGGSIGAALDAVDDGDTVAVRGGDYGEQTIAREFDAPVRVVPAGPEEVRLAGLTFDGARNIRLEGLRVAGSVSVEWSSRIVLDQLAVEPPPSEIGVLLGDGADDVALTRSTVAGGTFNVLLDASSDSVRPSRIRILDSELHGAGSDDIQISRGSDVLVEGNFIHHPQRNEDHNDGLQAIGVEGLRVYRNHFTTGRDPVDPDSQDQAIMVAHAPDDSGRRCRNVHIADNLVEHWRGTGINFAGVDGAKVINNTSYDNNGGWSALSFTDDLGFANTAVEVINNVLDRFTHEGAQFLRVTNNHVADGSRTGLFETTGSARFVPLSGYKLAGDSPAVDTAYAPAAPATDLHGQRRLGLPDRGAIEFHGIGPPTGWAVGAPDHTATWAALGLASSADAQWLIRSGPF